jgi:hypothetical protein
VDIRTALVTDGKPTIASQPGQRALDDPPVASQFLACFHATSCYPRPDAAPAKEPAAAERIVTFVGMELTGSLARPAPLAPHGDYGVYEFGEHLGIVHVGTGERHGEWHAVRVGDEVPLGAGTTPVYGVRAGLLAPFLAATLAESRQVRDQSIRPALPSSSSRRDVDGSIRRPFASP